MVEYLLSLLPSTVRMTVEVVMVIISVAMIIMASVVVIDSYRNLFDEEDDEDEQ